MEKARCFNSYVKMQYHEGRLRKGRETTRGREGKRKESLSRESKKPSFFSSPSEAETPPAARRG